MVSTWFLSTKGRNAEVEKKCTLLGRFLFDTTDRDEHEEQVCYGIMT